MNITSLADEYNFIFGGSWGGFSPYLYIGTEKSVFHVHRG